MNISDTKLKILKAAAELISSQGYFNVSVREICEASRVTKPVLYYYFKDKEDVLAELIKEGYTRFKELTDKFINPDASFEENLDGLLKVYIHYSDTYPYLIKISTHVQLSPVPNKIKSLSAKLAEDAIKKIYSIFSKGIKEKYLNKDVELEMLVHSFIAPFGVFIAQSVILKNNKRTLKVNLKKYFDFWKSQFLKKGKKTE